MLDWISEFTHLLASIVPRLVVVRETHSGVIFRRGIAKRAGPGMHIYWPVTSECIQICTVRQSLNLSYQSLITADGAAIVVAAVVVYRVEDALLALTGTDCVADTIHDVSMSAIRRAVNSCTFAEVQKNANAKGNSLDAMLRKRLQADLSTYGVAIDRAFLSDLSKPIILRHLGDPQST